MWQHRDVCARCFLGGGARESVRDKQVHDGEPIASRLRNLFQPTRQQQVRTSPCTIPAWSKLCCFHQVHAMHTQPVTDEARRVRLSCGQESTLSAQLKSGVSIISNGPIGRTPMPRFNKASTATRSLQPSALPCVSWPPSPLIALATCSSARFRFVSCKSATSKPCKSWAKTIY